MLFAVHPLRVESVAWVTERKDVLSGLFVVLTLGAYLGYASLSVFARPVSGGDAFLRPGANGQGNFGNITVPVALAGLLAAGPVRR